MNRPVLCAADDGMAELLHNVLMRLTRYAAEYRLSRHRRWDVLVHPEEVSRIVLRFHGRPAICYLKEHPATGRPKAQG